MIGANLRRRVRERAGDACEYCGLHQEQSPLASLQMEHVRPRKHGGNDDFENLALACLGCNLAKGSNLTGIDHLSEQVAELFNPRAQRWTDHFRWQGAFIIGLSAIGRTTIEVLQMNSDEQIVLRIATGEPGH